MSEKKWAQAFLSGLGGLTVYFLFFRALPVLSKYSNARNPYEAALLREGNGFAMLGGLALILLIGGVVSYMRKKNWRD